MSRLLFLNVAVKDVDASRAFFTELGFEFNEQFSDDKCVSLQVNEQTMIMLLKEEFFATFTKKPMVDPANGNEAYICVSTDTREGVDEFVNKAIAAGGKPANDVIDMGFMRGGSFYDLDNHHWEVSWMDPAALTGEPPSVQS